MLLVVIIGQAQSQSKQGPLPRSTPEEQGVSSLAINTFLDSIAKSKHEFHSFMFVRHGKVIAEGWWNPYRPDLKHTLYSLSKSFTATAVGFAQADGKLKLTDKVISFFPDQLPDTISANLRDLDIKALLTMSVGQEKDPTINSVQLENWTKDFLGLPIKYEPGSKFLYNSMATYMLSVIVQKVTGQKIIDYLKPRLFDPLGITGMDWETDPAGNNTGGWGLRLKTEDIAKFAQLFLQKGIWNGQQILPKGWSEEASTAHIIQHPEYTAERRASSDWEQGYGYQMWRCRYNAFRGDGAFGQYAIILPEQDAVIAITSETPDMQGELNLIWKILLPAMQSGKLDADKNANALLLQKLKALSLPAQKETIQPAFDAINGKTYVFESNALNIQSISFSSKGDACQMKMSSSSGDYMIDFAATTWHQSQTVLPGPYLLTSATNNLKGLPPFRIAAEYTWLDGQTLELVTRYIESPHTRKYTCVFDGNNISVKVKRSFMPDGNGGTVVLNGKAK